MYSGNLKDAADIQRRAISRDHYNGQDRVFMHCAPSISDMALFGTTTASNGWGEYRSSQTNSKDRRDFDQGTKTYAEAVNYCRFGWREGTERMRQLAMKLTPRLPSGQRVTMQARPSKVPVRGMNINIVAAMAGSPTPFVGRFPTGTKDKGQKIVRIAVNMATSAGVSGDTMQGKGAAILALVDTLQRMGKSVELTLLKALQPCGASVPPVMLKWNLLPLGARLSTDQLAFSLVSPACARRFFFAMLEHLPSDLVDGYRSGYGMPASINVNFPDIAKQYDIVVDSNCYIDDNGRQRVEWTSADSQVAFVKNELRKQGIAC